MNTLELIIVLIVLSTLNVVCFYFGANVGSKVAKGEKVTAPNLNPMEVMRAKQDKKEAQREQDRYDTILQNVENYNGTSAGQKEVPKI